MAHISGDEGLLRRVRGRPGYPPGYCRRGLRARSLLDDVTADQRRSAKAINFGLIYGMSAFGLARQLGITSRVQAQEYVNLYFDRYPGVKAIHGSDARAGTRRGLRRNRVRSPPLPAGNQCAPGAAPTICRAQRNQCADAGDCGGHYQKSDDQRRRMAAREQTDAHIIMQVHDELVFEVAKDESNAVRDEIITLMCAAAELKVPLKVDAGIGANWDEAH